MTGERSRTRAGTIAQVLTPAAIVGLLWLVGAVTLGRSIDDARSEAELLEATQVELVNQLAELRTLESWRTDLEAEQERLLDAVPETPRLDEFVRRLAGLAADGDVEVAQLAPVAIESATTDGGVDLPVGVTSIELSLTAVGDYAGLMTFLQSLQDDARLVVLDSMSILPDEENPNRLTLDVLFRVFTLQEAASVAADSIAFDDLEDASGAEDGDGATASAITAGLDAEVGP